VRRAIVFGGFQHPSTRRPSHYWGWPVHRWTGKQPIFL